MSEDELRGYFRAGMVKSVDRITAPGDAERRAAADVATALGETPPVGPPPPPLVAAATAPAAATANPFSAEAEAEREARAARALAAANIDFAALAVSGSARARRRASWVAPALVVGSMVVLMLFALNTLHRMKPGSGNAQQQALADAQLPPPPAVSDSASAGPDAVGPRQALVPATAVAAESPDADFQARSNKAQELLQAGDWAGLVAHAKGWSEAQPERNEPLQFLGIGYGRLGNFDQAADAINRVLQRDPGNANARTLLADLFLQGQKWQQAANLYKDMVSTSPNDARLWNNYGIALSGIGQTAQAVAALETAVRLDPNFKQAWTNLGNAYQALGDSSRAAAAYANGKP